MFGTVSVSGPTELRTQAIHQLVKASEAGVLLPLPGNALVKVFVAHGHGETLGGVESCRACYVYVRGYTTADAELFDKCESREGYNCASLETRPDFAVVPTTHTQKG